MFVQGARQSENLYLGTSHHAQHLQIVQTDYKFFHANTHNRLVVSK